MRLRKLFALYTASFVGVTALVGVAEKALGLPPRWIGWIFMALSVGIYVVVGTLTRTTDADQYYVAGRSVPALYNGMATASDWTSAAWFISMGGALSATGFAGLSYVMGWTGGYLLLAIFLAPYLRRFGRYTIPDFLSARYGGNAARLVGVLAAALACFAYVVAQVTGIGIIVARFVGLDFNVAVFLGVVGVLLCSVRGGMNSVTWAQVAQYIVVLVAYLVPVALLSWRLFALPVPQLTYGHLLQSNNARAIQLAADPLERATRSAWAAEAHAAKVEDPATPRGERAKLAGAQRTAAAQATAPAAQGATRERYLQVPTGRGMWNFLALLLCLSMGTAGLPHVLTRYYTTPSVRQARTSVGWSLFFVLLIYSAAPAYAAFARGALMTRLVGSRMADLPGWVEAWAPAGLFAVVDKLGDGVVQLADVVVKSTDFVVLATPEMAGLPFVVTGLVMAGGLAAALSTADGLLLTIANTVSHDLYFKVVNPRASLVERLAVTRIVLVLTALFAAYVATFRLAIIVELVAWAFSLAGAAFFPALVTGIWWKRANRSGALAGMIVGLGVTLYYLVASRFFGASWLGTATVAAGIFGIPLGFATIVVVSLATEPPSREMQDLVTSVRYPKPRASPQAAAVASAATRTRA
jgi:cation/acetate symporter